MAWSTSFLLYERRSSQLWTQLLYSCKKKAWKISFRYYKSCVYNCVDLLSYYSSPRSSYIWFSYIPNFIIILLQVYNESIQRSAPSWLVSSTGRALPRYRRGKGFESSTSQENVFSRLVFETSKVASITAIMFFHIIIHPVVLIYDFHIFITSFLLLLNQNFFAVRRHKNFKSGILSVVWNDAM